MEQGDFQREYFALLPGRMALVRIEDDQGNLVSNSYALRAPQKGPGPPRRSPREWVAALNSVDPVEQLSALVWLSGHHVASTHARHDDNVNEESVEDSELVEAVRRDGESQRALKVLANSDNPWVRAYATAAVAVTIDEAH